MESQSTEYFVFDLDHTLGDFNDADHYLLFLKPEYAFHITGKKGEISEYVRSKCDQMYKAFVKKVALYEEGIGILNKEMVYNVIGNVLYNKNNVTPKFGIYSNNPQPVKVQFAIDIIEEIYQKHIFCMAMDWTHPLREGEIVKDDPGNALKTWETLKKGLEQLGCGSPTPSSTWFFDDLEHPDLMKNLGDHYIHIRAYYKRPNLEVLNNIFLELLEDFGLDENTEYLNIYGVVFDSVGEYSDMDIYNYLFERAKKQERAKKSKTRKAKGGSHKNNRATKRTSKKKY